MSNAPFLRADDLVKYYAERLVLDGVSITAAPGQRIGLVGENGVGKSTLLRLLAGVEEPDSGSIHRPPDCGFLWQDLPYPPEASVQDVIDDALREIRAAKTRLDALTEHMERSPDDTTALAEYGDLLEWAQDHGLWDADRRAKVVLAGLGLGEVDPGRRLGALSGGQRARLALAALLTRQPRAMLLDEPTNHLDDEAIGFLERQLAALPGTVIVASHDRVFLEEVCTDIVDLDPSREGVTRYGGAYSDYLQAKAREYQRWQEQYAAEQQELKELRTAVEVTARSVGHARASTDNNKMAYDRHGGRVQKQISRRVRNAQQRLDELTRTQVRKPPTPLRFAASLTAEPPPDQRALSLRQVEIPGRLQVDHLEVSTSSRLMVTGPNGAGKSTLLNLLAGRLAPTKGEVHHAKGIRVALLDQEVVFDDDHASPRELYSAAAGPSAAPLSQLGLLPRRELQRPVGLLSTGQRRRVALALVLAHPPDVLLLDEPTNHLSLRLVEELEDALRTAAGAIVVATHDRWLRRTWEGAELPLTAGKIAA
ncbi:ABC-F family ATP-binding cassette domain-containing protein [Salinactinospora qingdaonensis]|uniref:ABC-F family ATP-binding cassette domain-containing protein n=1 Tax=Salinactinospora qingdaonensis TaxID=702744 RepID=A0ABP7G675_9ACTN